MGRRRKRGMREVNERGERTMRKGSRREGGKRKVNCRDKHKEKGERHAEG